MEVCRIPKVFGFGDFLWHVSSASTLKDDTGFAIIQDVGKVEKLLELMLRLPPEIRFEEVAYILEHYGFFESRSNGSHHVFRHNDGRRIIVPKKHGQTVKTTYIREVLRLVGELP
jgi:predicted RNA binding protein YcfA (HicA-like mRNA interferase family)